MRVIDLLNKIGKQEPVPDKILVDGKYFVWDSEEMFYQTEGKVDLLEVGKEYSTWDFLNFNVTEIPDININKEQQDIEIQKIEELATTENYDTYDWVDVGFNRSTINELIQAVKQLDKKINTKYCENCGVELNKENIALPNMCWECKYGEEK